MIAAALDHLESRGLIHRAITVDQEYLFRHALVQEAAYGSLLRADRKRLRQAANVLHRYPMIRPCVPLGFMLPVLALAGEWDAARALRALSAVRALGQAPESITK